MNFLNLQKVLGLRLWRHISWWSVLLLEVTGVFRENHRLVANHWQTMGGIRINNFGGDRH
jgi:hypothetical protein